MSFKSESYRVLIASPSDLMKERQIATEAIHDWNAQHSDAESVVLLPVKWETHAMPQSGIRPQEAINRQIVNKCDILIGMFWTKLGTKTGAADSGTVEEINSFVAAGKPALLYFSSRRIDPNKIDYAQNKKLKKFRTNTLEKALVGTFNQPSKLRQTLLRDLLRQIRELKSRDKASSTGKSELPVVQNQLQEQYQQFAALGIQSVYAFRTKVDPDNWCHWLAAVQGQCVLFGIANHNWCGDPNFEPSVQAVTQRQVQIKVFFLDPTKEIAVLRSREELRARARDTVHETKSSIRYMWQLKERLDAADRAFFRLFVYEGTPSGTNWFDDFMIVTHYLAGSANVNSPALRLTSTGKPEDLFRIYKENIEIVEKHYSIEITEANVANYV